MSNQRIMMIDLVERKNCFEFRNTDRHFLYEYFCDADSESEYDLSLNTRIISLIRCISRKPDRKRQRANDSRALSFKTISFCY